jgi:hypothetical protein
MAILHIEGFEHGSANTDLILIVDTLSTSAASFVDGRDGSPRKAVELDNGNHFISWPINGDTTLTYTAGFAFKVTALQNRVIARWYSDDGTAHCGLDMTSAGNLEFMRSSTIVEVTTNTPIQTGQWYYIEFQVLIDDTVGTYEVKVDGVTELSGTGVDTKAGAEDNVVGFSLIGATFSDTQYDDFYLLDSTGLTNNDFLGDSQVETLFPDADGFTNDFTPLSGLTNYEMVDDGYTPDIGTTYVSSSTVNHIDLYTFTDLELALNDIYAVEAVGMCWMAEVGPRTLRMMTRVSSTNYEGDIVGCPIEYNCINHLWETNPNTAAAWTESDINAAEFGITIEA